MKIFQYLGIAAVFALMSGVVAAQMQAQGQQQDQVSQIAEMLDLNDGQQQEIRDILGEYEPRLQSLESEAQQLHNDLQSLAGPDASEADIRSKAQELGKVTSDLTAESLIMDSKIQGVFTSEQRQRLEDIQQQQQQQQQQQMQQQFQEQMQ